MLCEFLLPCKMIQLYLHLSTYHLYGLPRWHWCSPANAGVIKDSGSVLRSGRSPGGGHGSPLQQPSLQNPTGRGTWRVMIHKITKSQTWLKQLSTTHTCVFTCSLFIFLFFMVYHEIWNLVPCAIRLTLLFTHLTCHSWRFLTPSSQSTPSLPSLSSCNHGSVL